MLNSTILVALKWVVVSFFVARESKTFIISYICVSSDFSLLTKYLQFGLFALVMVFILFFFLISNNSVSVVPKTLYKWKDLKNQTKPPILLNKILVMRFCIIQSVKNTPSCVDCEYSVMQIYCLNFTWYSFLKTFMLIFFF